MRFTRKTILFVNKVGEDVPVFNLIRSFLASAFSSDSTSLTLNFVDSGTTSLSAMATLDKNCVQGVYRSMPNSKADSMFHSNTSPRSLDINKKFNNVHHYGRKRCFVHNFLTAVRSNILPAKLNTNIAIGNRGIQKEFTDFV